MATLKDVAREVGVSVATVSYVLNGTGSVSKGMQDKVHAAVKRLGYRPNRKAQAMRTGISKSIGLILPDLTNPFFPELAQKVEVAARDTGFTVLLFDTQGYADAEQEGFQTLQQQGVDGIIWCPVGNLAPAGAKAASCPVVVVDRPIEGFDTVQSDYKKGGGLLADYIVQSGHRRIGLLSGPKSIESAQQRRQGLIDSLPTSVSIVWEEEVPFSRELTKQSRRLLKLNRASLIVAADDVVAIGAINVLDEYGIKVPDEVSVIGFDNIPWSTVVKPHLTTINQPVGSIGFEAVNLLLQKIRDPELPVKTVVLSVDLVTRDSVRILA